MPMTAAVKWIDGLEFVGQSGSGHAVVMSGSTESGGNDFGPRPMEMLLLGLGGCTGMDVVYVLRKKRQDVIGCQVNVKGEMADDYPHKYTAIELEYTVTGKNLTDEAVKRSIELSFEKYCAVKATLEAAAKITYTYTIVNI